MSNCDHWNQGDWESVEEEDWLTGEITYTSVRGDGQSACVDLDLHRWKCTKCGHIGYYSASAKAHYEQGIQSPYIDTKPPTKLT